MSCGLCERLDVAVVMGQSHCRILSKSATSAGCFAKFLILFASVVACSVDGANGDVQANAEAVKLLRAELSAARAELALLRERLQRLEWEVDLERRQRIRAEGERDELRAFVSRLRRQR